MRTLSLSAMLIIFTISPASSLEDKNASAIPPVLAVQEVHGKTLTINEYRFFGPRTLSLPKNPTKPVDVNSLPWFNSDQEILDYFNAHGFFESPKPVAPPPEPPPSDFSLIKILLWIAGAIATIFAVKFSLSGVIAALRWLYNFLRTRRVKLFICGLPAAGKTELSFRFKHPDELPSGPRALEPNVAKIDGRIGQFESLGLIFSPNFTDFAGSFPGDVIDDFRKTILRNILKWNPFRRRRALMIIVAPRRDNGDRDNGVDQSFVLEQRGAILSLYTAILQARGMYRPEVVILIVNKIDILSSNPGRAQEELSPIFNQAVVQDLKRACETAKVPYREHYISAYTSGPMEIRMLLEKLANAIKTGDK